MAGAQRRVVVVTGAAAGIGKATALRLARSGVVLALVDRAASLDEVATACREHTEVFSAQVDQTQRDAVDAAIAATAEQLGGIDGLFANAGYGRAAPFLDQPVDQWQRHLDVNLTGTFHVCQSVARHMVDRGRGGSIVVNASSGAEQYSDLLGAYCISKAGARMLGVAMASELGAHRIRVNVVLPGVVETPMTGSLLAQHAGARESLVASTPVGRLGSPDDVAALVAFLLSDDAGFMTGACVRVDGGQTIHGHPQWFATDYRAGHQSDWRTPPAGWPQAPEPDSAPSGSDAA